MSISLQLKTIMSQFSCVSSIAFVSFLVFAIVLSVHGQTMVSFAYDAAGNRVKREIVLSRSMPSAAPEDNYENTFFDTLGKRTVN